MNRAILLGRLGGDPEVKDIGETKVCKFSLATSESYTNKAGEKVTNTEWHNLIFWGKLCDVLKKWVHKGDPLLVEGKIVTRSYKDKQEVTHWTTEIVCDKFEFVGSAKKESPATNEGEWRKGEKREVKSMSDINELPGAEDDPSFDPFIR